MCYEAGFLEFYEGYRYSEDHCTESVVKQLVRQMEVPGIISEFVLLGL